MTAAATSGLMALTGLPEGPPLLPPAGVVAGLDRLAAAVSSRSAVLGSDLELFWQPAVTGRAALLGLRRQGRCSANQSCRLLASADGWIACNLARPDDRRTVAAVTGGDDDPWPALAQRAERELAAETVGTLRLLGVPAAVLAPPTADTAIVVERRWEATAPAPLAGLEVVDLSAMWAGPLVAKVLADGGAHVTKVESTARPDGARRTPGFYRWLHRDDQPTVVLDLTSPSARSTLRDLVTGADVVIEASRPRALEQLGCDPGVIAPRAGRVWLSITGYGRQDPGQHWVAFGDDAAVGGGLVAWDADSRPVFCGDAIADPLTGLAAAAAVLDAIGTGGGVLIDAALSRCAASLVAGGNWGEPSRSAQRDADGRWVLQIGDTVVPVMDPWELRGQTAEPALGAARRHRGTAR